MPEFIPTWASAIAQFEGFNLSSSRSARNHNPGNLKYAGQPGALGPDSGGFAVFADDVSGYQALYRQLQKYVQDFPGYSLLQMMAHYLGQSVPTSDAEGNAYQYASYVANTLGVSASTTLAQLAGLVSGADAPQIAADGEVIPPGDTSGSTGGGPSGGEIAAILVTIGLLAWAASRAWG